MNTRIDYIDTAKGIGMLLVIFAHINYMQPSLTIIYSFHMPLFFIISGMMFKKGKYKSFKPFIFSRLKSLICPYMFFSLISYMAYILIRIISDGLSNINVLELLKLFGQIFIAQNSLKLAYNLQLWFIPCLFLSEVIYWILCDKVSNNAFRYALIIIIVAFGWFTESPLCRVDFSVLPWNFSSACFSLGFFAVGNESFQHFKKLEFPHGICDYIKIIVAICIIIPILFCLAKLNGKISIGSRELGNGFLLYITGILGTFIIMLLSFLVRSSKVLQFIGLNSFYYMAVHKILYRFLNYVLGFMEQHKIGPIHELSGVILSDTLIGFIVTLVVSTIVVFLYIKLVKPFFVRIESTSNSKKLLSN